jgi:hypothetical protein
MRRRGRRRGEKGESGGGKKVEGRRKIQNR